LFFVNPSPELPLHVGNPRAEACGIDERVRPLSLSKALRLVVQREESGVGA
jgi:hypothetical protein